MELLYNMNRSIIFFLGLLTGIFICVLLYYLDTKKIKAILYTSDKKEVVTYVQKDTVYVDAQKTKKNQINTSDNSKVNEGNELTPLDDEKALYETEFSFDENEKEEVFSDGLLHTKTVKVKMYAAENQEGKLPDKCFPIFEIQQWSTPIKNKITYYRDKNMVKIKGMEVDRINVVFWNDAYFLEIGNRYYAIPETEFFEKLNTVNLP